MQWLESLVLGVVQGITEFLPVSSDGHLLLTQSFFAMLTGQGRSGKENLFFDVILHLGTTAAIFVFYRRLIAQGWRGLLGAEDVPAGLSRPEIVRVGQLAVVATSPLVPFALFFKKALEKAFEGTTVAGIGFLITAAVLLVTAWLRRRDGSKGPAATTWVDALLIGVAQMFAPLPGVSRSGLTIAAGLALGLSRSWSVGFSLLIAVPAILGAACYEVTKVLLGSESVDSADLTTDRVAQAVAATILAGVIGYFAIIWLTKIVRSGRIWYFSVYLVALAVLVLTIGAQPPAANNHEILNPKSETLNPRSEMQIRVPDQRAALGELPEKHVSAEL